MTKEVKDFIENNISARLRDMINEDICLCPKRIKDVEAAQQKLLILGI